jgi:hypothetical protein
MWFEESHMDKPFIAAPRPCATPHSAPVAWLKAAPPEPNDRETLIATVLADPDLLAEILARAAPEHTPVARHDGWTPDRIATFLEVLADTGIVAEGYRAAGMSKQAAYSLRSRDPVFAAAWRAAESNARPHVADGLLERSITGTVEHYYRNGVLVGERRHYESWLGLAVLKRLDKQAEEDRAEAALSAQMSVEWQATLDALRAGGTAAVPELFAPKVDEIDSPPSPPCCELSEHCWKSDSGEWLTSFAPPPGFTGYESNAWDGFSSYERACTPEEAHLLDSWHAATEAEEYAEATAYAEAKRDRFFARLRAELDGK